MALILSCIKYMFECVCTIAPLRNSHRTCTDHFVSSMCDHSERSYVPSQARKN